MRADPCFSDQVLRGLIEGFGDTRLALERESHLEQCDLCRNRLTELAAAPEWWREAAANLSSDELRVTPLEGVTQGFPNRSPTARNQSNHSALRPPSHPEMLGKLGRFDIDSCIGQGGFGVVYKGHDPELNRTVAIKVLAPHLAASGVARKRFAREAQAAAAISHPNVVPIHAIESEGDYPYLVMTYVPGQSLQAYVQKHGPLPIKAVVRIAQQVAAGLVAAHRQGLVHRDIKPANILLENGLNRAMITDFGLARAADDAAVTQTGWLAGTPHYMSPEQAEGKPLDERSDLFSLGSMIYFMATGKEPFRGEQPLAILRKIISDRQSPSEVENTEVPRTLSRLIDRLLEKDPADRFPSAEQVSLLLEQYLAHLHQPQVHEQPRLGLSKRVKRTRLIWTLTISLGCLFLGGVGYALAGWFTGPRIIYLTPQQCQEELDLFEGQFAGWPTELQNAAQLIIRLEESDPAMNGQLSSDSLEQDLRELDRQIRRLEAELQAPINGLGFQTSHSSRNLICLRKPTCGPELPGQFAARRIDGDEQRPFGPQELSLVSRKYSSQLASISVARQFGFCFHGKSSNRAENDQTVWNVEECNLVRPWPAPQTLSWAFHVDIGANQ